MLTFCFFFSVVSVSNDEFEEPDDLEEADVIFSARYFNTGTSSAEPDDVDETDVNFSAHYLNTGLSSAEPDDDLEETDVIFSARYLNTGTSSAESDVFIDECYGFGRCEDEPLPTEPSCRPGCSASCDECRPNISQPAKRVLGVSQPHFPRTLSYLTRPIFDEVDVDVDTLDALKETNDDVVRIDGVRQKRKQSTRDAAPRTRNVLRTRHLSEQSIAEATSFVCKCSEQCAEKVSRADVEACRRELWSLKEHERLQHVVNQMMFDMNANLEVQVVKFRTTINGKSVCGPFYKAALALSQTMYAEARKRICTRNTTVSQRERTNSLWNKRDRAVQFLTRYVEDHGQAIPNKNIIELPMGLTRGKLYVEFLDAEFTAEEIRQGKNCKLSSWYRYIAELPRLKFRKWMTFSRCSTCSQLKSNIEKCKSKEEKGTIFYKMQLIIFFFQLIKA